MIFTISCVLLLCVVNAQNCLPRRYKSSSVVCVCNSTYCDEFSEIEVDIPDGLFVVYTSSRDGMRFHKTKGKFARKHKEKRECVFTKNRKILLYFSFFLEIIVINRTKRYQKIYGFGGAFTDATGINVKSLSKKTQENLLRSYFSKKGVQYSLCRVPMGATDFSLKPYTYQDSKLEKFKLQPEDFVYKVSKKQNSQKKNGNN